MAVLAAIVLAGGESRRMGRTKAALPDARVIVHYNGWL